MVFPDSLIINRYKIIEKIASGGMSDVYLGMDIKLNRKVAIKILKENYASNKNFVNKFKRESQILAKLNSPNIVMIYDSGEFNNLYFIAMEYVEGTSLKEIIEKRGAMPPRLIANYAIQICNALEIAHDNNLIHRDIKPQNIIVTPEGRIKVTDFGIAKNLAEDATKTINILGTAFYISPEQAQGKVLDWRTDIYSLGIVMYEMLTSDVPFRGGSSIDISIKHINEEPSPPSRFIDNIPPDLEKIIMKCLEKNPSARYANLKELKYDLQNYLDGKPLIINGSVHYYKFKRKNIFAGNKAWLLSYYILSIFLIIIFTTLFIFYFGKFNFLNNERNYTLVPPIENINVENARKILSTYNLNIIVTDKVFSLTIPMDYIIKQSPAGNSRIALKSNIEVVVSKGVENKLISMPNIVGLNSETGTKILKDIGLDNVNIAQIYNPTYEKDIIIDQSPKFDEKIDGKTPVKLAVSLGEKLITLPNIIGFDYIYGKKQLEIQNLNVKVKRMPDNSKEPGTIISILPVPGTQVKENSIVEIFISTNEQLIKVPDLIQSDLQKAIEIINALNISFEVREITSDYSIQRGSVIAQDPEPGLYMDPGEALILFVGK
ncbi:MAG: protein kinase [Actinobacteria bacterium]|nr:protein kinase [Actinomycetota bacterium]